MNKWISVKDELPELFIYCLVMDSKGFINYAVYTDDVEYGENSISNYFAEIEAIRLEDGEYMCEDIGAEILNVTYYLELPQGFSMTKAVERNRNKLLYDSVVRGILETESNLAYENKKIYLVVLSVWVYECITEHLKDTLNSYPNTTGQRGLFIAGYEVKVIKDLSYSEPIQYIIK